MNTPNIDSFFTEVAALRNSEESLRHENTVLKAKYDQLSRGLQQKSEYWDKAAHQAMLQEHKEQLERAEKERDELKAMLDEPIKIRLS